MIDTGGIDVFLGLDVGKGEHHPTAVTRAGKKAFDKNLPNTEPKRRELFAKLQAEHGTVLVVVDQPASLGALPLAVARDMGCPVAYVPGLTMRRIADLYPGEAKTDVRDAFITADAARAMPPTLRAIDLEDETNRRTGDDRGLLRRPGRRGHPGREPAPRPADPDPPHAGTGAGAATAAPSRPHAAGTSDLRPRSARPDGAGWSPCCGRRRRGRPNGRSTRSSPRWTSRP